MKVSAPWRARRRLNATGGGRVATVSQQPRERGGFLVGQVGVILPKMEVGNQRGETALGSGRDASRICNFGHWKWPTAN